MGKGEGSCGVAQWGCAGSSVDCMEVGGQLRGNAGSSVDCMGVVGQLTKGGVGLSPPRPRPPAGGHPAYGA